MVLEEALRSRIKEHEKYVADVSVLAINNF